MASTFIHITSVFSFITREELKEAMKLMGENLSEADLDKLLNDSDTDKDGQINYEEFIRMLL